MPVNSSSRTKAPWLRRTGIAMICLSTLIFIALISVPWMAVDSESKIYIGGTLFVIAQISWWMGLGMVGPTAYMWFKSKFR